MSAPVRSLPWWTPRMTGAEVALVQRVIDSNYLNDGDVTEQFEAEIARRLGVPYAVACTSGTTAIMLGLAACGVGRGDEVIVPDVTFIATANAVMLAGATPVLVDVDEDTLNIDPAAFRNAISARTRAVVPVHVSGRGAGIERVVEIAREHGLAVVEDAAEGFMSVVGGRPLGTHGDAGAFSLSPNKTITTGQGGVVVTNRPEVHGRLRELKDQGRPVRGTGGDDSHPSLGYNFKFTNLQAAVGLGQLTDLDARLERQRAIHLLYRELLDGVPGIRLLPFAIADGETPQWTDALVERRDALDAFLASEGAGCRRFWHAIHTQAPYRLPDAQFPVASRLMPQALWLPSSFTLTDDDIQHVAGLVRGFLAG